MTNDCTSKVEEGSDVDCRHRKLDFNTVVRPGPLPVVRGELENIQSRGKSSENGVNSPARSQVSVRNIKSNSLDAKDSFNRKVLFIRELRVKRTILSSRTVVEVQLNGQMFP